MIRNQPIRRGLQTWVVGIALIGSIATSMTVSTAAFAYQPTLKEWMTYHNYAMTTNGHYEVEYKRGDYYPNELSHAVPEETAIALYPDYWVRMWKNDKGRVQHSVRNGTHKYNPRIKGESKQKLTRPFFDDLVFTRAESRTYATFLTEASSFPSALPVTLVDIEGGTSYWLFGDPEDAYILIDSNSHNLIAAQWPVESADTSTSATNANIQNAKTLEQWSFSYDAYASPAYVRYRKFMAPASAGSDKDSANRADRISSVAWIRPLFGFAAPDPSSVMSRFTMQRSSSPTLRNRNDIRTFVNSWGE